MTVYQPHQAARRGALHAWSILCVLTIAYTLAFADRQVLTLLAEPIRHAIPLSDTQLGMLQGAAFALCFALGGLPLGWLVDRRNRMQVVSGCIAVWSLATGSTGLAATYTQLLAARSATALAEAGCSPAAMSVLADVFAPRRLPQAIAVYMSAPYIGGGVALFAGSVLLRHFEQHGATGVPLLGQFAPWQCVFLVMAAAGLMLAPLVVWCVREPARQGLRQAQQISLRQTVRFVAVESAYLPSYFLAYACILAALFALLNWYPTLVIRLGYGAASTVGRPLGLIFLSCGLAGTLAAPWLVGKVGDAEVLVRVLRIARWMVALTGMLALAQVISRTFAVSLTLYGLAILVFSVLTAMMPLALQLGIPNQMRGRIAGLFLLGVNVAGVTLGSALVGAISDALGASGSALSTAMTGVIVTCSLGAFGLFRRTARRLPRMEMAAANSPD